MNRAGSNQRKRRGITLLELLIVVGIMLALVAFLVPALRPTMETRRIREAARAVNTYLNAARSHAMATGRPVGVMIERDSTLPQSSVVLRQVEVPQPYGGDLTDAVVRVAYAGPYVDPKTGRSLLLFRVYVRANFPDWANGLIRPGDSIQFNHMGLTYTIENFEQAAEFPLDPPTPAPPASLPPYVRQYFDFNVQLTDTDSSPDGFADNRFITVSLPVRSSIVPPNPWPNAGATSATATPLTGSLLPQPVPFTVYRLPEPSPAPPLQLPQQLAIDLVWSGTAEGLAQGGFFSTLIPDPYDPSKILGTDFSPVVLMFSAGGNLRDYYLRRGVNSATSPIYLLIGRRDRVPLLVPDPIKTPVPTWTSPAEDGLTNLQDLNSLWVAIQPQTGLITTSEVADNSNDTYAARKIAREAQGMGGR